MTDLRRPDFLVLVCISVASVPAAGCVVGTLDDSTDEIFASSLRFEAESLAITASSGDA